MAENIPLAVRGWQHANWCGSFYPDDLPADWQLAYYSNAFDAVLVPAEFWTPEQLRADIDWCDQVHPGFGFYAELPGALAAPARADFKRQLAAMLPNLRGVLVADARAETELEDLQQALPAVEFYQRQSLWTPAQAVSPAESVALAVLSEPWSDLRQLRHWLEAFTAAAAGNGVALICKMPEPDAAQLQQARTLMQIMGL